MTCSCRGVMHVCAESWEFMRTTLGVTRDEMERKLQPARESQAVLQVAVARAQHQQKTGIPDDPTPTPGGEP